MAHNPHEIGWIDSTDFDTDIDIEESMDANDNLPPQPPPPLPRPRATRGPILRPVRVVGRDQNNYVLYFEISKDRDFMACNSPWSVQGGLLAVFSWEPNMVLNRLVVTDVSVWVQLWGLPLEFHTTLIAQRIGDVRGIDWSKVLPRNIRFMRVRVRLPIDQPLLMRVMLANDQRELMWIQCRYERIFKLCRHCGRMGHSYPDCRWTRPQVTRALNAQATHLMQRFHVIYEYRPRNPEPMQFKVESEEEVPPPPNDTLQATDEHQTDKDIDPMAEEWFNNIEIDEELLPTLGMELIESNTDDPLSSSTNNTETQPVEPPPSQDPSQLDTLDP
ncbi:Endonuclease/exonuclease/phosphatase [Senna tora]|uniref:Endonuclease/exonuclease/phosphatase n=1 Tax=Senna tora TaxID=362788 RepID=A0A834TRF8_9FABA|nr:Endonuclease/exonuclease/phosphatase [Senna tora]